MGMDVYGINPKEKEGEYFRNNVWWWRPLAEFILTNYPDVADKCKCWHTNDGDGLNEEDAVALHDKIEMDLVLGRVTEYEQARMLALSNLEREACPHCNATGIRTDLIGKEMKMDTKELPKEIAILTGRTHGTCNACEGVGTMEHWELHYVFSQENVKEFSTFLKLCGGFKIC